MFDLNAALEWVTPVSFVAGGFLIGAIVYLVLAQLQKLSDRHNWRLDARFLSALGRMPILWFGIVGVYLATFAMPIVVRPSILQLVRQVLLVLLIFSATAVLARIASGLVRVYSDRVAGVLPSTSIFTNLVRLVVFITGILVILQSLGISVTPVLTALGVGGLAVALALQDTLSNLFSGFQIVASRQVRPGDYVKLEGGEEGYVTDVTWRNTTIRSIPNNRIIVPNAKLAQAILTNYNLPAAEMLVVISVGVSYDSDLEQVERVTLAVAREVLDEIPGGITAFEPFVRFHTFGDSSIDFNVMLKVHEFYDQYLLKHTFVKKLHRRYQEAGIEIPFPQRVVRWVGADARG